MKSTTAAFIMPVKLNGGDVELRLFREAVDSIKNQTDPDWVIIMVDDFSDNEKVYAEIDRMKAELKDKLLVYYSEKNCGSGVTRNKAVIHANEIGAPFILFNDSDDLSDPRRLEYVRKSFEDETVNVAYTSFDIIDENNNIWPADKINMSVREITDGHKVDIVEGENAWIKICTKKKYTNLTSCTAVRTSLAVAEPFPIASVSEDSHTWVRYGAHPGKFHFIKEVKGGYRICSGVQSRSRSSNDNFYEKMYKVDEAGVEEAIKVAKKYGTMCGWDENDIRVAAHVRLALSLLHGGSEEYCRECLSVGIKISKEKALYYIEQLYCEPQYKARMKEIANEL